MNRGSDAAADPPEGNPRTGRPLAPPRAQCPAIGVCGIVRVAHLSAYTKAGLPLSPSWTVWPNVPAFRRTLAVRGVSHGGVAEAVAAAPDGVVSDVAPPGARAEVLKQLPDGAPVLIKGRSALALPRRAHPRFVL